MRTISRLSVLVLFACLQSIVWSGELAENLRDQISAKQSGDLVPVWIKLPRVESASQFKASVNAQATTRAGRYQVVVNRFRQDYTKAQKAMVQKLKELKRNNLASTIKPHWITNIVEVEVAAGELPQLAGRSDVETIYAVPRIELIAPNKIGETPALSTGVGNDLTYINADDAWIAGYTGAGRVICSFDTGIEGDHPAFYNNWKGHDGDSAAAWFDPLDQESFPHIISGVSTNHGTQTMGILVGHDNATGDTIGVAPDAKWISAAVIDIPGTSIIDAFEWAADPDGDPNSIDDVPDVINHSWGVKDIGCTNIFYDLIDNLEALGIVNIFAAGNEGPSASTIRNPANRANDSLDCFAVGNISSSSTPPLISSGSSRGPSDCNGAIKPNVTAPGVSIRTSIPGGSYGYFSGTSAATPHVSGLVALLRQKNPNATVDEIKEAILTTAIDYGDTGPDNDFGWGVIDCMAALNALSPINVDPNVRVYAFDHPPIAPGDTVVGTVVLQNIGADVTGVSATVEGLYFYLTVLNGSAFFGGINEGDTVRSDDSIKVIVADSVPVGSIFGLYWHITGDGGYSQYVYLHFLVEPPTQRLFVTHDASRIEFTVSNFGTYGLGPNSFFPAGGVGFTFDGGANDLYEGGLMIGTAPDSISDGVRNPFGEPDGDFQVLPGGNIELIEPGTFTSQETFSRFSASRAETPIRLEIIQQSYASDSIAHDDFLILRYIVKNTSIVWPTIHGLYVGLYLDWDIVTFSSDAGGWEASEGFAWMAYNNGVTHSSFRAVKVVDGITATAFTATSSLICYTHPTHCPGGDGFTEQEKYDALTDGFSSGSTYKTAQEDLNQVISVGPITLHAGQVDTIAFALLAGNTLADITAAAADAQMAYDGVITDVEDETGDMLPTQFTLSQNYPNPFNPHTTIEYSLPVKSHVVLSIYNILGQKVRTLIDKNQGAGCQAVLWDGKTDRGKDLASGIYLYHLKAGEFTQSRKMLLLK